MNYIKRRFSIILHKKLETRFDLIDSLTDFISRNSTSKNYIDINFTQKRYVFLNVLNR